MATPPALPPTLSPSLAATLAAPEDVATVATALQARGWMMATAESCTGGLIAAACTDVAGSSSWFDRGFVTYSNAAKSEMLGVPTQLIDTHGAVSEAVARAMAQGAAARAGVAVAVSVTGVAGPGGGSADKPVGTVWMCWSIAGTVHTQCLHFAGERAQVRQQTRDHVLQRLAALLAASS